MTYQAFGMFLICHLLDMRNLLQNPFSNVSESKSINLLGISWKGISVGLGKGL